MDDLQDTDLHHRGPFGPGKPLHAPNLAFWGLMAVYSAGVGVALLKAAGAF